MSRCCLQAALEAYVLKVNSEKEAPHPASEHRLIALLASGTTIDCLLHGFVSFPGTPARQHPCLHSFDHTLSTVLALASWSNILRPLCITYAFTL